jgi:hypothetical protein
MKMTRSGGASVIAAAALGLLGAVATMSDSDARGGTSQFFVMPLTKTFLPPSGYGPPDVAKSNQSFILVPQMYDIRPIEERIRAVVPSRPPFWQQRVAAHLAVMGRREEEGERLIKGDAHLAVMGVSAKYDDRLHQPGEGTLEGGVTVFRPGSPRT